MIAKYNVNVTRSVAAGFRRHGMPPLASNDTGTAFGQDGTDWSHDLATLTFDLVGHGTNGWCKSSSSIHVPSLFGRHGARCVSALMGLMTLTFDLETGMRIASMVGNLHYEFGHARPSVSPVICYVHDGQMDGQKQHLMPHSLRHNNLKHIMLHL